MKAKEAFLMLDDWIAYYPQVADFEIEFVSEKTSGKKVLLFETISLNICFMSKRAVFHIREY